MFQRLVSGLSLGYMSSIHVGRPRDNATESRKTCMLNAIQNLSCVKPSPSHHRIINLFDDVAYKGNMLFPGYYGTGATMGKITDQAIRF
jgi:hypothetical protein